MSDSTFASGSSVSSL